MEKQKNEDELGNEANPAAEMTNAIQNNQIKGNDKDEEDQIKCGLELSVDESNLLHQMWKKVELDEAFYKNYEQWLEDEVWGYYD